ncbi:hypothetical protein [Ralstonia mannitolilytica]|uniref:hypothetical protein n=1 Tax=Ralstonia mannitolilytica TaxID=105219 RepID=UPI0012FE65AB|nr:hypothetical protein [Ralstonia mannitolilytica]QIF09279.1 hypothetical protein G5A69_16875 [Ralstonia mannitolilytica]
MEAMAETINIAKMAEKLSKGIFNEFLWGRMEHTNINWSCENKEKHEVKTHPSDVVFWYDEPYSQSRTYVNCDLKSYAQGSITTSAIREAIESLAKTLSCAEVSQEFSETYIHQNVSANIHGMLFVYNHDGGYDKEFSKILDRVRNEDLDIPRGAKIVVFGPEDIFWLNNVHHEIIHLRGGAGLLPERDQCRFFYPHLVRRKNVQMDQAKAATLEMLTAPWIILSYVNQKNNGKKGFVVFMRKRGSTVDEFLYLIEYLMHYQVITDVTEVTIRILDPHPNSSANFAKAKDQYVSDYQGGEMIKKILDEIDMGKLENVRTTFCELELSRQ